MGSVGISRNSDIWTANADTLNGSSGVYNVYRSGDLSAPNGMVFLATNPSDAEYYGEVNRDMDAYSLDIRNPLIIDAGGDVEAVQKAWKALHPDKELKLGPRGLEGNKWQQLDKQNSTALTKSNYDAVLYRIDGKITEIQIPGKQRDRLNKRDTKDYLGTTTYKNTSNTARDIARNYTGDEAQLAAAIVSSISNSKYTARYIPYMHSVNVELKRGTALNKSRSSIFYKLVQSKSGKWFVSLSK